MPILYLHKKQEVQYALDLAYDKVEASAPWVFDYSSELMLLYIFWMNFGFNPVKLLISNVLLNLVVGIACLSLGFLLSCKVVKTLAAAFGASTKPGETAENPRRESPVVAKLLQKLMVLKQNKKIYSQKGERGEVDEVPAEGSEDDAAVGKKEL